MVESMRVSENSTIHASTEKMIESGRVAGKGKIHGSTKKSSVRVPKRGKPGRVPEKGFGRVSENVRFHAIIEKLVESVRVLTNYSCEFWKMVESGRVPKKCRIRASTGKGFGRLSENGRIRASNKKMVESG